MKLQLLAVLGLGSVLIGLTVWATSPRPAQPGKEKYRFMHSPKCGREFAYNAAMANKPRSRCGREHLLEPTTYSVAQAGGPRNPYGGMFVSVYAELTLLLAAVWCVTRPVKAAATPEVVYSYTRCGKCKRKLRFAAEKEGSKGQCPRCKTGLIFTANAEDEEEEQAV